jgi:hypothetical protein
MWRTTTDCASKEPGWTAETIRPLKQTRCATVLFISLCDLDSDTVEIVTGSELCQALSEESQTRCEPSLVESLGHILAAFSA